LLEDFLYEPVPICKPLFTSALVLRHGYDLPFVIRVELSAKRRRMVFTESRSVTSSVSWLLTRRKRFPAKSGKAGGVIHRLFHFIK
jgi:hypothetical protein